MPLEDVNFLLIYASYGSLFYFYGLISGTVLLNIESYFVDSVFVLYASVNILGLIICLLENRVWRCVRWGLAKFVMLVGGILSQKSLSYAARSDFCRSVELHFSFGIVFWMSLGISTSSVFYMELDWTLGVVLSLFMTSTFDGLNLLYLE